MKPLKHKLQLETHHQIGSALSVTGFSGPYRVDSILPYSILPKQELVIALSSIWLFRAVKKNCISGEPASPIADRCASIERIKTDHNSYTASCHSLVFQQPMRIRDLSRGMVVFVGKSKAS